MPTIEKQMIALLNDPAALHNKLNAEPEFVRAQDEEGRTLLHHAFTRDCYTYRVDNTYNFVLRPMALIKESWRILLTSPFIDPNIQDNYGKTAIHRMVHTFYHNQLSYDFKYEMISNLYSRLNDLCSVDYSRLDTSGQSALHYAARGNPFSRSHDLPIIVANKPNECTMISMVLLKQMNVVSINLISNNGNTALDYAINNENFILARILLKHGANPYLCSAAFSKLAELKEMTDFHLRLDSIKSPTIYTRNHLSLQYSSVVSFQSLENEAEKIKYDRICRIERKMNKIASQFKASANTISTTKTVLNQARKSGHYPFTLFSNEVINCIAKYTNESKLITKADIADNFARYRK